MVSVLTALVCLMYSCTSTPISYSNEVLYVDFENLQPPIEVVDDISIITWNIQFGFPDSIEVFSVGSIGGSHAHLDNLCQAIKSVNPTIVGLQEVAINLDKSIVQNQAQYLAECLNMNYAVGQYSSYLNAREPFIRGKKCLTILTKYRIEEISNTEIYSNQPDDRRTVLSTKLADGAGTTITALNIHISSKSTLVDINNQIDACKSIYTEQSEPSILLGDFNLWHTTPQMQNLKQSGLSILAEFEGQDCTFETTQHGSFIDHILIDSSAFMVQNYCLLDSQYWHLSDHKGVMGIVKLKK